MAVQAAITVLLASVTNPASSCSSSSSLPGGRLPLAEASPSASADSVGQRDNRISSSDPQASAAAPPTGRAHAARPVPEGGRLEVAGPDDAAVAVTPGMEARQMPIPPSHGNQRIPGKKAMPAPNLFLFETAAWWQRVPKWSAIWIICCKSMHGGSGLQIARTLAERMDPLSSTAAAGLRARLEALDLLANNLANTSTPGFKADREVYALYIGQDSADAAESGFGRPQVFAPMLERHQTDARQGVLVETGNPFELALSGEGYFLLEAPDGIRLTRAGRIQIDRDGRLISPEGFEFVAGGPRPIRADPGQPVEVDQHGVVHQNGAPLGRLRIVEAELSGTARREGVYFQLDRTALPGLRDARARVHQGKVEASNVSVPETAVRLVTILRQFETLQKAIQLGGEMGRRAVEEVARINP